MQLVDALADSQGQENEVAPWLQRELNAVIGSCLSRKKSFSSLTLLTH